MIAALVFLGASLLIALIVVLVFIRRKKVGGEEATPVPVYEEGYQYPEQQGEGYYYPKGEGVPEGYQ